MQKEVCLVIPCYQEAIRLQSKAFPRQANVAFVFVDDGSQDGTLKLLREIAGPQDTVLALKSNQGKAEAVRQGMLHALNQESTAGCTWFGFWDADFATPLQELNNFLAFQQIYGDVSSVWGSRVYRLGASIERSFLRHIFGRLFATVAKTWLGLETYDSQCGAKIFRREIVEPIFRKPFESRWLFDLELYFRLQRESAKIIECPLREWRDIGGGQLKIGKMAIRTLRDLWKIWRVYR